MGVYCHEICLDFTPVVNSDAKSSLEVHIISLTKFLLSDI